MKNSTVITTFFTGAAGVLAGMLFAPGKGSKTRSELSRKGYEYKEFISDNINDFVETVSRPLDNNLEDEILR